MASRTDAVIGFHSAISQSGLPIALIISGMKFRALLLTLSLAGAAVLTARSTPGDQAGTAIPPETRWLRAIDAWEAGRYPAALEELRALMRSPAAAEYLERVALLTGELYVTTDVTANGRNPRISADGRYVSYETGTAPRVVTKLVRVEGGQATETAELPATGVSFAPTGTRVLYLRPKQTTEYASALKAYDEAATPADRLTVQTTLDYLQSKGDLVVRDFSTGAERIVSTGNLLKATPAFSSDGHSVIFLGADEQDLSRSDIYVAGENSAPARVTDQPGHKTNVIVSTRGGGLLYTVATVAPFRIPGPGGAGREGGGRGAGGGGGGRGIGPPAGAAGGAAGAPAQPPPGPNPCGGGRGGGTPSFGVIDLASKTNRVITGSGQAISADGTTVAWL